jgi:hypothetical protein
MATSRQIAANRRNAVKSTGPRTSAGKRRARRNSYLHGLSIGAAGRSECAEHIERLARKIAGADAILLEQARIIAQAQLDLIQIRRMRTSLIQQMAEFRVLEPADALQTFRGMKRMVISIYRGLPCDLSVPPPAPSMPSSEPDRTAEAMRRALPELLKLDRYERSAAARRDRAARLIAARRTK